MDGCKVEFLKSKLDLPQKRNATSPIRKLRTKELVSNNKLEVSSTPRTPRRSPSPNVSRNPTTTTTSLPKRAQSAERRPSTSSLPKRAESTERRTSTTPSSPSGSSPSTTPASDTSSVAIGTSRKGPSEGIWPTRSRNLFSSFQLEPVPVSKKDKSNATILSLDQLERKRTPLGQSDNMHVTDNPISKMMEKQRWPGMAGGKTASINLSRSVDLTDKFTKPGTALSFLRSRGTSPKRSPVSDVSNSMSRSIENGAVSKLLSQLGSNATSRSVDLPDRPKKPITRGNSPRRIFSSNTTDEKDKNKRSESRGPSPARNISGATIGPIARSRSVDATDKTKRPVSSSPLVQSRGPSPLRIPAGEVTESATPKRPESRGSSSRTFRSEVLSSADLGDGGKKSIRGPSPGRHSVSEFPAADMSRGMDLDRSKRPASSSGQKKTPGSEVSSSALSASMDLDDRGKRSIRGPSPVRRSVSIFPTRDMSRSTDLNRNKRPASSAGQRRTPGSEVPSISLSASVDLGDRGKRSIRGASPGRRSVSDLLARDMQRSLDLDRSKRPASSSGQRKSFSYRNSESDEKTGLGPNTPPQRSERSNSLTRASRTIPSFGRPSSPSTKRITQSPSRERPSTPSSTSSSSSGGSSRRTISTASFVNSVSQTRKVKNKVSGNQVEELHQQRLLHSRHLQWLFVNACVEDMHLNQKMSSESMLYGMWSSISELRDSVLMKRLDVQQLTQETKLIALLNEQIDYLDSWAGVERDHCTSLAGAIEAIRATTIRLPVTGGAKANVLAVRNAVSSAVDIMQAMGSSICFLLSKVENKNSLVEELAIVSAKEKAMLEEGRELLATVAKLHVQESSLKTQLIQLRRDGVEVDPVGMMINSVG